MLKWLQRLIMWSMMEVDYTDISNTYDRRRSYPRELIKKLVDFGTLRKGMKILDAGCGTGNIASQLHKQINIDIIGLDSSLPMLKVARGKSLEVICADADNHPLPFQNGAFDRIIVAYFIHQINNLSLLFAECYRILCDSGVILLLTSSHKQIEYQHPVLKEFFPSGIEIDKRRFPDVARIDYLLDLAGFRSIKHDEVLVESIALDWECLDRVKSKYVSTYHLLPHDEFELGVTRLEAFIKRQSHPNLREWRGTLIYGQKNG